MTLRTSKNIFSNHKFKGHGIFAGTCKYQHYQTHCHVDTQRWYF